MKWKFLLVCILFGSITAHSQEVKIKKDIVYVDGSEYMKMDDEFGNTIVTNVNGDELLTIKTYSFEKPNPARNNTNDPARYNYPATIKEVYYVISFLDFELEYEVDLPLKKLFLAFYKYNLLNTDNTVNQENAKDIAEKISKDVSGERPYMIIGN
ncbi:MAG: hypothetical protein K1X55_14260 [Chitinophagales bacterium]|nr:hypothetical protein [Chitinophagales bacterium]